MSTYKPMETATPADRSQHNSYFKTTYKFQFYHWFSSLIILPTFFAITHLLLSAFERNFCISPIPYICVITAQNQASNSSRLLPLAYWAVLIIAMIPAILSITAINRPWWRSGFRSRGLLIFVSSVLSIYISLNLPALKQFANQLPSYDDFNELLMQIYLIIFALSVVYGLIVGFLLITPEIRKFVTYILTLILLALLLVYEIYKPTTFLPLSNGLILTILQFTAILPGCIAIILMPIYRVIRFRDKFFGIHISKERWEWFPNDNQQRLFIYLSWFSLIISFIPIIISYFTATFIPGSITTNHLPIPTLLLWVVAIIFSTNPRLFISRQRAYIRNVLASLRHDRLRTLITPLVGQFHPINRISRLFDRIVSGNWSFIILIFIFIIAGFILPLISIILSKYPSPALLTLDEIGKMVSIGIPSVIISTILYICVAFINARQKYIILPFEIEGDEIEKHSLMGVSRQLQHGLVAQIQKIGLFLQLRQIENVHTGPENGLTRFVASGQGLQFTEELRAVSILDVTAQDLNSRLGRLLLYIVSTFAIVKVRGSMRRRSDNSLQIWIELNRKGQSSPIDMIIIPTNFSEDVDELVIQNLTRTLATKLVQKIGNNYHLGSSWESLDKFLDGIAAAVDGNWWRAIDSYRTAIQIEESFQGTFALGHYHLGSALVSVGELEEGIQQLEQAAHSDPLFAETRYMLALTRIYKSWDKLHEKDIEFQQAEQNCMAALKLRHHFAEVHHLLGSAHYQRGRLAERAKTEFSTDGQDALQSATFADLNYIHEYNEAAKFLRRAINSYDRELRHISRNLAWHRDVETEMRRILRARMTAIHQLGDALCSQCCYAEADTYYEDFNVVYPNSIRTLVAVTKMYCLSGQWQRADEYLRHSVFSIPESHWNADVNLHAGWALAGGIYEMDEPLWGYLYKKVAYEDRINLMVQATQHIDYAIHQNPQYISRWSQNDWQTDYNIACISVQRHAKKTNNWLERLRDWLLPNPSRILRYRLSTELAKKSGDIEKQNKSLLSEKWDDENYINGIKDRTNDVRKKITRKVNYQGIISEIIKYTLENEQQKFNHIEHIKKIGSDKNADTTKYIQKISDLYCNVIPYIKEEFEIKSGSFDVNILRSWLSARMDMCLYSNAKDPIASLWLPSYMSNSTDTKMGQEIYRQLFPNPDFADIYERLKLHYDSAAMLLQRIDESGRFYNLANIWYKLKLAVEALDNWKHAQSETRSGFYTQWDWEKKTIRRINKINNPKDTPIITFADRWTYAVFISVSTFATRWLIEASAYEVAWRVAQVSIAHLTEWRDIHQWKEQRSIAPFVFRYARATLCAYKAYCAIQMEDNAETRERLEALRLVSHWGWDEYAEVSSKAIAEAPQDLQTALQILPRHPLAMFVSAHIHRRNKLTEDAVLEFGRLASVIESFDPIDFLANWEMIKKTDIDESGLKSSVDFHWDDSKWSGDKSDYQKFRESAEYEQWEQQIPSVRNSERFSNRVEAIHSDNVTMSLPKTSDESTSTHDDLTWRKRMEYQENIIGQGQIANFINKSQVHWQIARVHELQNKIDLAINHLMRATLWSKRRDLEIKYLMVHIEQLGRLDRFKDAQSVSKILKSRQIRLEPQAFTSARIRQPDILMCIMSSRMKEYSQALQTGYQLFIDWTRRDQYSLIYVHTETTQNFSRSYYEKLGHPDLIWFYEKLNAFLYEKRHNLKFANQHIKIPNDLEVIKNDNKGKFNSSYIAYTFAKQYFKLHAMGNVLKELMSLGWIVKHPSERNINERIPGMDIDILREQRPRINIGWNITMRIFHALCEESMQILEQYCQLLNIIVYDRVELNLEQSLMQNNDISDIPIPGSLLNQSNTIIIDNAINIMTALLMFADELKQTSHHSSRFREHLRNYYDTKGWMIFRNALPYQRFNPAGTSTPGSKESFDPTKQVELQTLLNNMEQARYWLTKGVSYDPSSAILHYHLARVHLAVLERLWQSRKSTKASDVAEIAAMFQDHLRQAASCWRRAINYDASGRLRPSLNWLGQRIEQYSRDWKARFLTSLRDGLSSSSDDKGLAEE